MPSHPRHAIRLLLGLAALCLAAAAQTGDPLTFNRDVRPILSSRCFHCHGPDRAHRKARLRLDVAESEGRVRGGLSVIDTDTPEESELLARLTAHDPDDLMPPPETGVELTAREIATLRRWVLEGASWERHWSYAPLRRPTPPAIDGEAVSRHPVDRFLAVRWKAAGVEPAAPADPVTLVRRLHLDLTGLPPSPEAVDAFLAADEATRVGRLVDELLASPRHAERMAMWWFDLVRYADTVGYHGDQEHAISPYRDWVIKAFLDDMPFDRFTTAQLAGDLIEDRTEDDLIASAYNRMLQTTHEGGAQDGEYRAKYAADRVRNVSSVWMGATLGCAECHDHKYDPYTQEDFYRLAAFFADIEERGSYDRISPNRSPTTRPPEIEVTSPLDRHLPEKQRRRAKVMITRTTTPRVTRVLARGDWMDEEGAIVGPGVPEAVGLPLALGEGAGADGEPRRPTRADLARWLCDPRHPQTSRVLANRLFALMFGRGLARDMLDLGSQGTWPDQPELLDWLATEIVRGGWRIRPVLRRLATSRAYALGGVPTPALRERDPENALFARQTRHRVHAETVRDVALHASGLLVDRLGGASARPYQPAGYYAHLNFPRRKYRRDENDGLWRRSLYIHWQRQFLHPVMKTFDAPARQECTAERPRSNTPLQALTRLNATAFVEAARAMGSSLLDADVSDDDARLTLGFRRATSRVPSTEELAVLRGLLARRRAQFSGDPDAAAALLTVGDAPRSAAAEPAELAAWTSVSRALLNLGETITRP